MLQLSYLRYLPDSEGAYSECRSQTDLRTANSADPGGGGRAQVLCELSTCEHGPIWSKWRSEPITGPILRIGHRQRPREWSQERMNLSEQSALVLRHLSHAVFVVCAQWCCRF